ncbi:MAG TPA: amylo-alpha-1,6-glucosidase [Terriglobia bacterium]|nr:amylo-alpha-1,6-glucosidase [Terriglobia bacterium]
MVQRRTTLRWIGVGAQPTIEGIQSTTVDPDTQLASEGAPEWLVTNGLGGYASGTMTGLVTRRFHGYLVAALPAPRGRTMMLNHLRVIISTDEGRAQLSEQPDPDGAGAPLATLREFRLELGIPVWTYEHHGHVIETRVIMPHRQNTVFVTCERISGTGRLQVTVEPWIHFRPHEGTLAGPIDGEYALRIIGGRYEIEDTLDVGLPPLRIKLVCADAKFSIDERRIRNVTYLIEQSRGYDATGDLYSPGTFRADLEVGVPAALVASVEDWRTINALSPAVALAAERARRERLVEMANPALHTSVGSELVLAADQFLIHPAGRLEDAALAHALGDEERTIIAGYPWFTDWGRDTMISLEGLTLATGRTAEAGYILRTFAEYLKDGLIPNMFPEGKGEGLYHTADATLWFFHATKRYVDVSGDRDTLRRLFPLFEQIITQHQRGTRFGIQVDPADGLLMQGAAGYQLTWMDAKVGDLVVTPRRGKAVEIEALWYNALRLMEEWTGTELRDAEAEQRYRALADRVRESFNARFWNERAGALFDVVDGEEGDDDSIRPNQLFAISLPHPVLDQQRWQSVVDVAHDRLLTPYGLRSLAPDHPNYQPQYFGDLRARDMAYHQGTVWPWLIGPFFDAWRRVYPDRIEELLGTTVSLGQHLASACIGSISEIFDAEPPYTPRGCCAQAWSVAEVLRVATVMGSTLRDQKSDTST